MLERGLGREQRVEVEVDARAHGRLLREAPPEQPEALVERQARQREAAAAAAAAEQRGLAGLARAHVVERRVGRPSRRARAVARAPRTRARADAEAAMLADALGAEHAAMLGAAEEHLAQRDDDGVLELRAAQEIGVSASSRPRATALGTLGRCAGMLLTGALVSRARRAACATAAEITSPSTPRSPRRRSAKPAR